jgi:hypothetical protein
MFLELRLHQLSQCVFVYFCLLRGQLNTLIVENSSLLFWGLRGNDKHLVGSHVAGRIAVQNVAAILAVVLGQAPAESLGEQLLGNSFLFGFRTLISNLDLDLQLHEFVFALCVVNS